MKKVSKLSLVVLMFAVIVLIGTQVFATNNPIDISDPNAVVTSNNTTDTNAVANTTGNTTNNTLPAVNNTTSINNTNSAYNNTSLPKTGAASDFTIIALVVVCAVAAVYAYKKIKDYNIK
ncbi:MAG: hypothetical protein ACLU8F_04345 [Clostridia bacterium]